MNYIVISITALLLALSGCIGTMDSIHTVNGNVVSDSPCEFTVLISDTSEVIQNEYVKGNFSSNFIASGPIPENVDFIVTCNGKNVKEIKDVYPRSKNVYEIGKIEP